MNPDLDNLTIIIKTFLRRHTCQRSINIIRKFYPTIKIYVADDSPEPHQFQHIDQYYYLGFDKGLSYGRNYLIEKVTSKYFFLTDDDIEFGEKTWLEYLIYILERYPIDMIGCRPINYEKKHTRISYPAKLPIENQIMYRKNNETIGYEQGIPLYDFIPNCFVARTEVFKTKGIKWDEELKMGEHYEFFYRNKGLLKIGYAPTIILFNRQDTEDRDEEYLKFRKRSQIFESQVNQKLKVDKMIVETKTTITPPLPVTMIEFMKGYCEEISKKHTFIFGLGISNEAILSFVNLLNQQDNIKCLYRGKTMQGMRIGLSWKKQLTLLYRLILTLGSYKEKILSDNGSYLLPYVGNIIKLLPEAKCVIIRSEKEKVIEELKKTKLTDEYPNYYQSDLNINTNPNINKKWQERYWKGYEQKINRLGKKYPNNVKIINDTNLNSTLSWLSLS